MNIKQYIKLTLLMAIAGSRNACQIGFKLFLLKLFLRDYTRALGEAILTGDHQALYIYIYIYQHFVVIISADVLVAAQEEWPPGGVAAWRSHVRRNATNIYTLGPLIQHNTAPDLCLVLRNNFKCTRSF